MDTKFEARLKAYRAILGSIFHFFLEPEISKLPKTYKYIVISKLFAEAVLLGSSELQRLLGDYKFKVLEFHDVLNVDDDQTNVLHKELAALTVRIHNQMRVDLGINDEDFLLPYPFMEERNFLFGEEEQIIYFRDYLLSQAGIIIDIGRKDKLQGRAKEIASAIMSTMNTAYAIAELIKNYSIYYNECVMLSRGLFERILNLCYLLVCDDEGFNEYRLHTKQKMYRKMDEKFTDGQHTASVKFSNIDLMFKDDDLQKAIKKFTKKSGKELKQWPTISIPERIQLIGNKSNINTSMFLVYQLGWYTDASESIHGSFYGNIFHLGAHLPGITDVDKSMANLRKNATLLLMVCGEMIYMLTLLLAKYGDIDDQVKLAGSNSNKALSKLRIKND